MYLNRGNYSAAFRSTISSVSNSAAAISADINSLSNRITASGGTISSGDLAAIEAFAKTIYDNNLRNLFTAFYPYAGNDWSAAREALWFPSGQSSRLALVGTPFVSTDYTRATGFRSEPAGKGFSTGFGTTDSNWSYSVYLRTAGGSGSQIGTSTTAGDYLAQNFGGITYYSSRAGFTDTTSMGYYTAQSTNILRNGVQTNATNSFAASGQHIFIHGRNNNGTVHQASDRGIGCVAIGLVKAQSQEQIIYNAIQTLMTAFGRAV